MAQKVPHNPAKITGASMKRLREKLALNQTAFWSQIGVTQSGASRYESGRNIPLPTRNAIAFIYDEELAKHRRAIA
jgi:DNA-binding transcriptional regulator YiaG